MQGLTAIHEAELVHRDLKPGNIVYNEKEQRYQIIDFGLARDLTKKDLLSKRVNFKELKGKKGAEDETSEGAVLGTLSYLSPEQGRAEKVDARADLFSVGTILYEMTTGTNPFKKDNFFATIGSIATEDVPDIKRKDIPPEFQDLIHKLLAKNPEDRYQSAEEACKELQKVAKKYNLLEQPQGLLSKLKSLFKRKK